MDIEIFPEINTKRLLLRELTQGDWERISYLRSDPEVNKYVKRTAANTKEMALKFIQKIKDGYICGSMLYWVICKKGSSNMIGSICLWRFSENRKKAEVGYDLDPQYHRQGIMDEALKAILFYGYNSLNLTRLEAYTSGKNIPSVKLLERNGFSVLEGRKDEENPDNIIFGIRKG